MSVLARTPLVRIGPSEGKFSEQRGDFLSLSVRLLEEERDRSEPDAVLSASRMVLNQQTMVVGRSWWSSPWKVGDVQEDLAASGVLRTSKGIFKSELGCARQDPNEPFCL